MARGDSAPSPRGNQARSGGHERRRAASRAAGQAKAALAETQFTATLKGLEVVLRATARRHVDFAGRLAERDLVAQIRLDD